jgi:hypothetical protein
MEDTVYQVQLGTSLFYVDSLVIFCIFCISFEFFCAQFFSMILPILLALTLVSFDGILSAASDEMIEPKIDHSIKKNQSERRDHHDSYQGGYNEYLRHPLKSHDKHKRPRPNYGAPKSQHGPPKGKYGAPKPNNKASPFPGYSQSAYNPSSYSSYSDYSPPEYSHPDYSSSEYSSASYSPHAYSSPVYNPPAPYSPPYATSYDPTAYSPSIYPETPSAYYNEPTYPPQYSDPAYPYKNSADTDKGGYKGVSNNDNNNGFADFDDFFKQTQKFKQF